MGIVVGVGAAGVELAFGRGVAVGERGAPATGMRNVCPICKPVAELMLLADAISSHGMPNAAPMPARVSPDCTTYVTPPVLAVAVGAEAGFTARVGLAVAGGTGVAVGATGVAVGVDAAIWVTLTVGRIPKAAVTVKVAVIGAVLGTTPTSSPWPETVTVTPGWQRRWERPWE